ncbi:MAG: prepilin-type N-terminal cleavage/methylation domain-containing protein [Planctomycetota bacterium]
MKSHPSNPRSAFTLIELLVVISIIALLIGILLPALGAARQTSRIAASGSNQRQIAIAMAAYQADNDSYFPLWQQSTGGTPVDGTPIWYWTTRLGVDNYIPGAEVYRDPAFANGETPFLEIAGTGADASSSITRDNMDDRRWNRIHYGYNFVHVGGNYHKSGSFRSPAGVNAHNPRKNLPDFIPARLEDMDDATAVLVTTGVIDMFIDGNDPAFADGTRPTQTDGKVWGAHVVLDCGVAVGNAGMPHARYNDSVQIAWADGHVSAVAVPFTGEDQEAARFDGISLTDNLVNQIYRGDSLGNVNDGGFAGFSDPVGNYFDIVGTSPDNNN